MRKLLLVLAATLVASPAAAAELTFLGKTKTAWLKDLASDKPDAQHSAAFALGRLGDGSDQTLAALTAALRNQSPAVRDAKAEELKRKAAEIREQMRREEGQ